MPANLTPEQLAAWQNARDASHRVYAGPGYAYDDNPAQRSVDGANLQNYNYVSDPYQDPASGQTVYNTYDSKGTLTGTHAWEKPNTMADLTKAGMAIGSAYLGAGLLNGGLPGMGGWESGLLSNGAQVGAPMGAGAQGLAATDLGLLGGGAASAGGGAGLDALGAGGGADGGVPWTSAAADSQAANAEIAANGGNPMAGYQVPTAPAVASGSSILDMLKSVGIDPKTAAQLAAMTAGAATGSKGTTSSVLKSNTLDPRLDPYVYGPDGKGGLMADANAWYQNNKSGLNDQMREGLNDKWKVLSDPATMGAYRQMADLGSSLMSTPVAGNPFTTRNLGLSRYSAPPVTFGQNLPAGPFNK